MYIYIYTHIHTYVDMLGVPRHPRDPPGNQADHLRPTLQGDRNIYMCVYIYIYTYTLYVNIYIYIYVNIHIIC